MKHPRIWCGPWPAFHEFYRSPSRADLARRRKETIALGVLAASIGAVLGSAATLVVLLGSAT